MGDLRSQNTTTQRECNDDDDDDVGSETVGAAADVYPWRKINTPPMCTQYTQCGTQISRTFRAAKSIYLPLSPHLVRVPTMLRHLPRGDRGSPQQGQKIPRLDNRRYDDNNVNILEKW